MSNPKKNSSTAVEITNCPNCSGDLVFNPGAQTLDCQFCSTSYNLKGEAITQQNTVVEIPQKIIPFTVTREAFDKALVSWLSQGKFTPGDILDSFSIDGTKGVYMPISICHADFTIATSTGAQDGSIKLSIVPESVKSWPDTVRQYAENAIKQKDAVKPYEKVYTLGFELLEDDWADEDYSNKCTEKIKKIITTNSRFHNPRDITIKNMEISKAYMAFWTHKYSYGGNQYLVIMSGCNTTEIDGTRPVDEAAAASAAPSFKYFNYTLLFGLITFITAIFCAGYHLPKAVHGTLSVVGSLALFLGAPILLIVTLIRRAIWTNPEVKLNQERTKKMQQYLSQRIS